MYLRQLERQSPPLANSSRRRISTLSSWFTLLEDEETNVGNAAVSALRPRRHATAAAELLQLVERCQPDVAIVDIRMPTHTDEGLRAAKQIRTQLAPDEVADRVPTKPTDRDRTSGRPRSAHRHSVTQSPMRCHTVV